MSTLGKRNLKSYNSSRPTLTCSRRANFLKDGLQHRLMLLRDLFIRRCRRRARDRLEFAMDIVTHFIGDRLLVIGDVR